MRKENETEIDCLTCASVHDSHGRSMGWMDVRGMR